MYDDRNSENVERANAEAASLREDLNNFDDEADTLGPCGCTDYHMADCSSGGAWLSQDSQDPLFLDEPDDDPRQYEDEDDDMNYDGG